VVTVPEGQLCVEYEVEMYDLWADGWQSGALHFDFNHKVSWTGSYDYYTKAAVCLEEGAYQPQACDDDFDADLNENCWGWALSGECDVNPAYMLGSCLSSCNKINSKFWKVAGTGVCGGVIEFCHAPESG